jgi:hypothetical protein
LIKKKGFFKSNVYIVQIVVAGQGRAGQGRAGQGRAGLKIGEKLPHLLCRVFAFVDRETDPSKQCSSRADQIAPS